MNSTNKTPIYSYEFHKQNANLQLWIPLTNPTSNTLLFIMVLQELYITVSLNMHIMILKMLLKDGFREQAAMWSFYLSATIKDDLQTETFIILTITCRQDNRISAHSCMPLIYWCPLSFLIKYYVQLLFPHSCYISHLSLPSWSHRPSKSRIRGP